MITYKRTMNKPIIMIDFHGVYLNNDGTHIAARKIAKKFGLEENAVYDVLRHENRKKYGEGKVNGKDYWKHVSRKLKISSLSQLNEMEKMWHSCWYVDKNMLRLVRKLKKKYRVVVLSGNIKERVEFMNKKYNFDKDFHEQHYSYDHGVNKPDVRLFTRAIKKMKANPKDCIVIDDMSNFLESVRKLGAKTILFKDAKHLENELRNQGVEI